jgi:hypothetical protein
VVLAGELSCEVVEAYNKIICRHIEHRTNQHVSLTNVDDNKYFQTLRHFLVQIMCFPDTLFSKKRRLQCSVCKAKGHQKNNTKRCKLNSGYRLMYDCVYGDEQDDPIDQAEANQMVQAA